MKMWGKNRIKEDFTKQEGAICAMISSLSLKAIMGIRDYCQFLVNKKEVCIPVTQYEIKEIIKEVDKWTIHVYLNDQEFYWGGFDRPEEWFELRMYFNPKTKQFSHIRINDAHLDSTGQYYIPPFKGIKVKSEKEFKRLYQEWKQKELKG